MAEEAPARTRAKKKTRGRPGDGSIYKDNRGYWTGALSLPRVPGQKPKRKVIRSKDKRVVQSALAEWREQLRKMGDLPSSTPTCAQWFETWMGKHVTPHKRPRTAEGYESIINRYLVPVLGSKKIDRVRPADVQAVIDYVTITLQLSSTTARNAYRTLSKSLEDAMRAGMTFENAASRVEPPKANATDLDVFTLDEVVLLLEALATHPNGARWATFLFTGQRRGEVFGLEPDRVGDMLDISWQLQRLRQAHGCGGTCGKKRGAACPDRYLDAPANFEYRPVKGSLYLTRPKSKAGWRIIPLVEPLKSILERHMRESAPNKYGLLFADDRGEPLNPDAESEEWRELMKSLFGPHRYVRLHDLRHATVDLLYLAGVPEDIIQLIVGHTTRSMVRYYKSNKDTARLVAAMHSLSALVSGGEVGAKKTGGHAELLN